MPRGDGSGAIQASRSRQQKQEFLTKYTAGREDVTYTGTPAKVCIDMGISINTFYSWMKKDPKFRDAIRTIQAVFVERAEKKVGEKIANGDDTWLWRFLKNRGGWSDEPVTPATGQVVGKMRLNVETDIITGPPPADENGERDTGSAD